MDRETRPERHVTHWALNVFAFCIIALMLAVAVQVFANLFDINPLMRFDRTLFWLGDAVTLNSLLDLQWHLLAVVALLPAGLVWLQDRHVRVDFLYSRMAPRQKTAVDLVGHVLFAAPFLLLAAPAAWDFAARALASGEGSRNGGLNDLWLIKSALPLGLALLGAAVLWEAARLLRELARR